MVMPFALDRLAEPRHLAPAQQELAAAARFVVVAIALEILRHDRS
jgi:hypothetical protein